MAEFIILILVRRDNSHFTIEIGVTLWRGHCHLIETSGKSTSNPNYGGSLCTRSPEGRTAGRTKYVGR